MQRRYLHSSIRALNSEKKRLNEWNLPDLDKLPGRFKGKIYNKRDWNEHLTNDTKIYDNESHRIKHTKKVSPPPEAWRKNKYSPQWLRNKYALKEKELKMDISNTRRLSRTAIEGIKALHDQFPEKLPNEKLAEFFKVSPVAVSKILKSRWTPSDRELTKMNKRWEERTMKVSQRKLIDQKFNEFLEEKQRKLGMEIPYFFKQELLEYYNLHGIETLETDFVKLNQARIENAKVKDAQMSAEISAMIENN